VGECPDACPGANRFCLNRSQWVFVHRT
jgi:hypothetical protein